MIFTTKNILYNNTQMPPKKKPLITPELLGWLGKMGNAKNEKERLKIEKQFFKKHPQFK